MRHEIDETRVVVLRDPDAEALRRHLERGPVVVISGVPKLALFIAQRTDQPWGLLPPDVGPDEVKAAVRAVAAGFTVLPPSLTTSVLAVDEPSTIIRDRESPMPRQSLTPRERDVLQRLADGLPNRAIGQALGISDHTVKFHLASIFGKLGAGTRTEAVRLGLRLGLVTI
jgi:NarL family two-component system response regulator YdfI